MNEKEVSTLHEDSKEKVIDTLELNDKDTIYYGNLLKRLQFAKDMRDREHDEFDGMTYLQYVEANRKGANTYISPKKNKADTNFVSGTIRQKLLAYLAAINNLDLNPDIQAFDNENNEIKQLGEAMEDILFKVGELDNDEEKKILRQYELLVQGNVFIEEKWEERWRKKKTFNGKLSGIFSKNDKPWKTTLKKAFSKCTRELRIPENIYLGDIRQFDMDMQPYIYAVEIRPWEETKSIYGKWDNWKYIPKKIQRIATQEDGQDIYSTIELVDDHRKEECEIIKYQDKWNDEYMILINGVMMLKPGTPLSALSPTGEYTIEKQILEPINAFFAYGKSVPARMKTATALLDEMYKMAILKTQKSFAPSMANNTGKVLSSRIFDPGRIINGIDIEKLQKIDPDARGVQSSEFQMLEMLQRVNDTNTTDPTFSGQQPSGSPTATQVLEVQRQAKMMIGLTVFSMAQLEKKIAWSRINNVLAHWFEKADEEYNTNAKGFIDKYRSINRSKMIDGKGMGSKIIKVSPEHPSPSEIMREEDRLSTPNNPVRIVYLNPEEIKKSKYKWYVSVTPKERKTDALNKVLFDEMMQKAMLFPNINMGYLGEEFAQIWEQNPSKLFKLEEPAPPPATEGSGSESVPGLPKPPSPAQAAGGIPPTNIPLA